MSHHVKPILCVSVAILAGVGLASSWFSADNAVPHVGPRVTVETDRADANSVQDELAQAREPTRSEIAAAEPTQRTASRLVWLEGRTIAASGEGVAGAVIELLHRSRGPAFDVFAWADELQRQPAVLASTTSDARGRFHFRNVPAEWVSLTACAEGYAPRHVAALETGAARPAFVTVTLAPAHAVRGSVVDPDGQPVAHAEVVAVDDEGPLGLGQPHASTETTADGEFVLKPVGNRPVTVLVRAAGFAPTGRRGLQPDGKPVRLEVRRGARVTGRVFDLASDRSIAGAQILAISEHEPSCLVAVSDADGSYILDQVPAGVFLRLIVRADGYHAALPFASRGAGTNLGWLFERGFEEGSTVEQDLVMIPAGSILGSVRDAATGAPIDGAQVLALSDRSSQGSPIVARATSSADGSFALGGVPPGEFALVTHADGYVADCDDNRLRELVRDERRSWNLPIGHDLHGVEISLARGTSLGGLVVDRAGEPVRGARVSWLGAQEDPIRSELGVDREALGRTTATDAAGRFSLDGMPENADVLVIAECVATGLHGQARLRNGPGNRTDPVPIVVDRVAELRGRLVSPDGAPIASAELRYHALGAGDLRGMAHELATTVARTDRRGRFVFAGIPAGAGRLVLAQPEEFVLDTGLRLEPGRVAQHTLRADQAQALRGRVVDAAGHAVDKCDVTVLRRGRPGEKPVFAEMFTAADGQFAFWRLPDGEYVLRASRPDLLAAGRAKPEQAVLAPTAMLVRPTGREVVMTMRWVAPGDLSDDHGTACELGSTEQHPRFSTAPSATTN